MSVRNKTILMCSIVVFLVLFVAALFKKVGEMNEPVKKPSALRKWFNDMYCTFFI